MLRASEFKAAVRLKAAIKTASKRASGSRRRRVRRIWRCFHCDEVFRSKKAALLHFGPSLQFEPACQIDVKRFREIQSQLKRYQEEDTDLHRQIRQMECDHQQALRRADEAGYAKGLMDGRIFPANAPGEPPARRTI